MALLSLGLIIIITLLYPTINFAVVQSVNALISGNDRSPSLSMRRTISLVGMGLALLLDTVVVDMGYVFGLCRSPGLGFLAYVLPCASFLSIMLAKRKAFSVSSVCAVLIAMHHGARNGARLNGAGHQQHHRDVDGGECRWRRVQMEAIADGGHCRWRPVYMEASADGGQCRWRPV
jgi:hypothetical protein